MPMFAALNAKTRHIQEQIAELESRRVAMVRVGGSTVVNWADEIAFQQTRLDELTWAGAAGDGDIRARIATYAGGLSASALACKYGDTSGLTQGEVSTLAKIEVLEIALGIHPGLPPAQRNPMGVF